MAKAKKKGARGVQAPATPPGGPPFDPRGVSDEDVEKIIEAAQIHGEESEPAHEVGDLQVALRAAWLLLTPEGKRALLADTFVAENLSWLD